MNTQAYWPGFLSEADINAVHKKHQGTAERHKATDHGMSSRCWSKVFEIKFSEGIGSSHNPLDSSLTLRLLHKFARWEDLPPVQLYLYAADGKEFSDELHDPYSAFPRFDQQNASEKEMARIEKSWGLSLLAHGQASVDELIQNRDRSLLLVTSHVRSFLSCPPLPCWKRKNFPLFANDWN